VAAPVLEIPVVEPIDEELVAEVKEEAQQEEAPVEKKKKSYDPFDDILSIFREK
jgi:hypothetical protein